MQIRVNTDNHIQNSAEAMEFVESAVEDSLSRFAERLTRVEVHLSDENSAEKRHNTPMRCRIEARPAGRQPVAVSADAETIKQALDAALHKMERLLDSTFDRLDDRKGRTPFGGDPKV